MADPTVSPNVVFTPQPHPVAKSPIKNLEALVVSGFVALNRATAAQEFAKAGPNLISTGVVIGSPTTQEGSLTGDGTKQVVARGGFAIKYPVTGASAVTDITKSVYAVDGQTLSLTKPAADAVPVGFVQEWLSGTTCMVYLYSLAEALLVSQVAISQDVFLTRVPSKSLEATTAQDLLTARTFRGHFLIDKFYAVSAGHDTGIVAGAQILNLEIGAVNVTGSDLTLGFASVDGDADLGTITSVTCSALNEVHDGDTVSVERQSGGTGFTAAKVGAYDLFMSVAALPGA